MPQDSADHHRQLAVELAKRHNGEVINGDAMQLYEGLPILTNKITAEEQQGIPHHFLGRIKLDEQPWVVGTFVKMALGVIEEIRSRGRLPILVGGTHYYTQALLFKDRLADQERSAETYFTVDTEKEWPILGASTEVLLQELKKVDPVMAERWHPNDYRKIRRSLEIYLQTGKKASDVYQDQRDRKVVGPGQEAEGDHALQSPAHMRFPTLIFWVHCNHDTLIERLDKRVDTMVDHGLINEVHALNHFERQQSACNDPVDETRGIWVSIGYKQFRPYAQAIEDGQPAAESASLLKQAILSTKTATRQYAKRQVRWIRIKLLNELSQTNARGKLYLLDGSDISSFDEDAVATANGLMHDFLSASKPMPEPSSLSTVAADLLTPKRDYDISANPEKWNKHVCSVCGVTCVTEDQWKAHCKSKAHRKKVAIAKKEQPQAASNPDDQADDDDHDGSDEDPKA